MTQRTPLDPNQLVTLRGSGDSGFITRVHPGPGDQPIAYTVQTSSVGADGHETQRVSADKVDPELLDLELVDGRLRESSGHIDNPDAPYNWAALQAMRTAEVLRAENGYLRRLLELVPGYTRLGARDGAIAAAGDALLVEIERQDGLPSADLDAATADSYRDLADVAVRAALPILAPFAAAMQEIRDILPGPCSAPNPYNGYDSCEHGVWPCYRTRAAWIADGLNPDDEQRKIMAQLREEWLRSVAAGEVR